MKQISRLFVLILVCCLLGAVAPADEGDPPAQAESRTLPPVPEGLNESDSVTVSDGMDETTVANLYIKTDGDGITVNDMSEVTITGCYIVADGAGIRVNDSGQVSLRDSFIHGKEGAVYVDDDGEVHATDCVFYGKILKDDNGAFFDEGFNSFQ